MVFVTDPSQGGVLYQVADFTDPLSGQYSFIGVGVVLQAGTSGGVIPPLDHFNLNDFDVDLSLANNPDFPPDILIGHLTSFPTLNLNQVPDGGTSVTLLCWGLASLAVLRCWRRASGATGQRAFTRRRSNRRGDPISRRSRHDSFLFMTTILQQIAKLVLARRS